MFKSAAHSVLRTKNRKWVKRQKEDAEDEDEDSSLNEIGDNLEIQNSKKAQVLERHRSSPSKTTSIRTA